MVWAEKPADEFTRADASREEDSSFLAKDIEIEQDKSLSFHQPALRGTASPRAP